MDIRGELEALRGSPILVGPSDPMSIPCIETSDRERLCKNPVVSVQMITYNHEPYIRQAIEGVMMQKTDFEFELIIGEDCSQDKTREICLEYQKKYPDKIRVLWWHENVSKLGGNGQRCRARCRGEFIALCEGDDYWVDPYKLQKQVDAMRRHYNVSLCFADADVYYQSTGTLKSYHTVEKRWGEGGAIPGKELIRAWYNPITSTMMFRRSVYEKARMDWDIFSWMLKVGDVTLTTAMCILGDVWCLTDVVSVYRVHSGSAMQSYVGQVYIDSAIVRLYFMMVKGKELYPDGHWEKMKLQVCRSRALLDCQLKFKSRQKAISDIARLGVLPFGELFFARTGKGYRFYNYLRIKKTKILSRIIGLFSLSNKGK